MDGSMDEELEEKLQITNYELRSADCASELGIMPFIRTRVGMG
jgi:hypothetical protein